MKPIQKLIYAGFATAALASASLPALAWTVWPDVDFEWYARVGQPASAPAVEVFPAPRAGYIWAPGHWERRGTGSVWVAGQWIADDYNQQLATYGTRAQFVEGMPLRDSNGDVIPTSPDAYPADTARR
jgi:hypothetical protein